MSSHIKTFLFQLFIGLFSFVQSSHFRGALFSWKPTSEPDQTEIAWRISWRRSTSSHFCDMHTITNETLKSGEGTLSCYSGCSGGVSLAYYCTDYSESDDWTTGVYTNTFSSESPIFTMRFNGGNWIGGLQVGSNGRWSLPMDVNLTRRDDTGIPNSSPVSSVTPIVQLQYGCNHTFVIPVFDPDNDDTVRCRWASGSLECADVCNGFPHALLDENTCTIRYNAQYRVGLFAVALMIEDFRSASSTTPLSKIPLQFLVNVFSSEGMSCTTSPEFVYPTPEDGSCINVPENETYRQTLAAVSGSDAVDISAIDTVSPFGFLKSPVTQVDQLFYVNVTWTPTQQQFGANILCYTAYNTAGQATPQTCITLVVGETAPNIIQDSIEPAPGSYVPPTQSTWRLKFDKKFQRPTTPTYIRFYEADSDILVHLIDVSTSSDVSYMSTERSIEFTTNGLYLQENETYYILMDSGVARGMELCGSESPAITNPGFWWFKIRTGLECGGGCLNGGICDSGSGDCKCRRGFAGPTCKRILGYCSKCNIP